MKWIRTGFQFVIGFTMLGILLFISGVIWLIETEDKKNPSTLH